MILMVAVNPLYGSILLIISGLISIVIPLKLLHKSKNNSYETINNQLSPKLILTETLSNESLTLFGYLKLNSSRMIE